MRTGDPKVFAAGDGAFGPSTIVKAMYHGHRAAYYVKHFLEGDRRPAALPDAVQDPARACRPGRALGGVRSASTRSSTGSGANPVAFPEIESTYNEETAKREAARCYRCDAETGSSDYNVRTREDIFVMARTKPEDARKQRAVFTRRLTVSNQAHFHPRGAVARRHRLPAGEPLAPRHRPVPRRVPGRDADRRGARAGVAVPRRAASTTRRARCARRSRTASERRGSPTSAARPLGDGVPWLQLVVDGEDAPTPAAAR